MTFATAVRNEQKFGKTGNGAKTLATTGNSVLDFFGAAGNRNVVLNREFDLARSTNSQLAYRVALWARDIRGGAGERQTFRNLLSHIERHYPEDAIKMIPKIPELGRWDDLFVFTDANVRKAAFELYAGALIAGNGLAAKWAPRKGDVAVALRKFMGLTPKAYRKLLVKNTKVVETLMCAKEWEKIVFDHVPSVAAARYQKAFYKRCGDAYAAYKKGLVTVKEDGTTERKINASAVFPYDVVKSVRNGDREVASAQWNALPNFLGDDKILPIVDVSGSMNSWNYYGLQNFKGKTPSFTPMDIALSIGLYVADKQAGDFNGLFMTFSDKPKIQHLKGNLVNKLNQMISAHWSMSTNIQAAYKEILDFAKRNAVSASDMPKVLLILSDMEFNPSTVSGYDVTAHEAAKRMFESAGYMLPKIVYWNINGRADNNPVTMDERGTAIVSGFSPSIFKSILKADLEDYSPESVMLETLKSERYDIPGLTI